MVGHSGSRVGWRFGGIEVEKTSIEVNLERNLVRTYFIVRAHSQLGSIIPGTKGNLCLRLEVETEYSKFEKTVSLTPSNPAKLKIERHVWSTYFGQFT